MPTPVNDPVREFDDEFDDEFDEAPPRRRLGVGARLLYALKGTAVATVLLGLALLLLLDVCAYLVPQPIGCFLHDFRTDVCGHQECRVIRGGDWDDE